MYLFYIIFKFNALLTMKNKYTLLAILLASSVEASTSSSSSSSADSYRDSHYQIMRDEIVRSYSPEIYNGLLILAKEKAMARAGGDERAAEKYVKEIFSDMARTIKIAPTSPATRELLDAAGSKRDDLADFREKVTRDREAEVIRKRAFEEEERRTVFDLAREDQKRRERARADRADRPEYYAALEARKARLLADISEQERRVHETEGQWRMAESFESSLTDKTSARVTSSASRATEAAHSAYASAKDVLDALRRELSDVESALRS